MKRREFITLLGGATTWPLAARAQQPTRMRRIGVLMGIANDSEGQSRNAAFLQGLKELGWTDGSNVTIELRWVAGDSGRMQDYAAELVGLAPDVIMVGTTAASAALRRETRSIPIVFAQVTDPVGFGLVSSLARPGGNITGFTSFEYAIGGKWLQILKEIEPKVDRTAVIYNPDDPASVGYLQAIEAAAPTLGVRPTLAGIRDAIEIEPVIKAFAKTPNGSLLVVPALLVAVHRERIISAADQYGLPAVYPYPFFAASGGLISYGVETTDLYRRAASYVDRILKGEKPAELPVQQPNKYELVINMKTAKALGLTVPPSLLTRADEVIE